MNYTPEQVQEILALRQERHDLLRSSIVNYHPRMQRINKRLRELTQNHIYR
jgi:hypothetical protein